MIWLCTSKSIPERVFIEERLTLLFSLPPSQSGAKKFSKSARKKNFQLGRQSLPGRPVHPVHTCFMNFQEDGRQP